MAWSEARRTRSTMLEAVASSSTYSRMYFQKKFCEGVSASADARRISSSIFSETRHSCAFEGFYD